VELPAILDEPPIGRIDVVAPESEMKRPDDGHRQRGMRGKRLHGTREMFGWAGPVPDEVLARVPVRQGAKGRLPLRDGFRAVLAGPDALAGGSRQSMGT